MPTAPTVPLSGFHTPVLADAVRTWAQGARRAIDATLGGGGHAALLRDAGAEVLGIDRDPAAVAVARERLGERGMRYLQAPFHSSVALEAIRAFAPDRILLDLGVSSHQIDSAERGFTFRPGAPLDMRMAGKGEGGSGIAARDILNSWPIDRLTKVFGEYGDERRANALAKEIVRRRMNEAFVISDDFVNAIRAVLGPRSGPPDFARLFQALRIAVNDELAALQTALPAMRDALSAGGRLAVITYHSGEDRIVKNLFRDWAKDCICPPRQPICTCRGRALGTVLTKKPIMPDAAEVAANPRARSAQLRIFERSPDGA